MMTTSKLHLLPLLFALSGVTMAAPGMASVVPINHAADSPAGPVFKDREQGPSACHWNFLKSLPVLVTKQEDYYFWHDETPKPSDVTL